MSYWHWVDLKFDGKKLTTISTNEVVVDFTIPLWKTATKAEIEYTVQRKVRQILERRGWLQIKQGAASCS